MKSMPDVSWRINSFVKHIHTMVFIGGSRGGCWGAAATPCCHLGLEQPQVWPSASHVAWLSPEKPLVWEPAGRGALPASVHCLCVLSVPAAFSDPSWDGWLRLSSFTAVTFAHSFLDTQCFALTQETCRLLEHVWQKGHMGLFSAHTGCRGGRAGRVNAPRSWPPPSCPGRWDSSFPAPWPCSPFAAVACRELVMSGSLSMPHYHCSSGCHTSKGRGTIAIRWPGEGWWKCPGPSGRKASQPPRMRCPLPTHLCCCDCTSWVSWMLEPGRKGENPPAVLGLGMESCYKQLSPLSVSTNGLIQCSKPHQMLSWSLGMNWVSGTWLWM